MASGYARVPSYTCNCGQKYASEEALRQHRLIECQSQRFSCSFCEEDLPTSADLRKHLVLCGNKTDECPKCRRLIRRSHFAYHYENNCASINDVETPPNERRSRVDQSAPRNPNKPVARVDIPIDDYRENYQGQRNGRQQSPMSSPRNSPRMFQCEYCHRRCDETVYKDHREKCAQNAVNMKNGQSPRSPLIPKQNRPAVGGIVHLPCEICDQPIDLPNWSSHIQTCREREAKRIKDRARSISADPVTESFPCEHCHQQYHARRLHDHEANCPKNPGNAKSPERGRPQGVNLPVKRRPTSSGPARGGDRPAGNRPGAHYDQVDFAQMRAVNQSPMRHDPNEQRSSSVDRSPRSPHVPKNGAGQLNPATPYRNASPAARPPSDDGSPRRKPAAGKSPTYESNEDPGESLLARHHSKHIGKRHGNYQIQQDTPDRPTKKKSSGRSGIARFFGCGSTGVYD